MSAIDLSPMPLQSHPALLGVRADLAKATRMLYECELPALAVGDDTVQVRFGHVQVAQVGLQLHVRCAGCDYEVQVVDATALANMRLALSPSVPVALQKAAVMHALQPLWQALEARFSSPIELCSLHGTSAAWPSHEALGLTIVRQTPGGNPMQSGVLLRALQPQGWTRLLLAERVSMRQIAAAMDSVAVAVSVWGESVRITLAELALLEPGDALLLKAPASEGKRHIVSLRTLGHTLCGVAAVLHGQKLTISSRSIHPVTADKTTLLCVESTERSPMMSAQPKTDLQDNALTHSTDLNAMHVEVELELARLSLPISVLRNLSVGQVFDTDQAIDGNVIKLWCGGQCLGVGQLVTVGDRLAVRIAAMEARPLTGKD